MTPTKTDPVQITRRFTIKGRVQGVWFRDSTRREARGLGITGFARNQPNGDVEVLASGTEAALAELQSWLHAGPPMARVESVTVEALSYEAFRLFDIA